MRAAVLETYGVPRPGEFDGPVAGEGKAVVEVRAAGLNPFDLSVAAGLVPALKPKLPSVPGTEGVGMLAGRRVYFGTTVRPFGSMAERALVDPSTVFEVPDGVDDGAAVALGTAGSTAWLALSWRGQLAAGEHVLVLGASGALGGVALQAARLLGAGRVIAAARSREGLERARELGADAAVPLDERDPAALAAAFREAAHDRIDVVVDPLWGQPALAALQAASRGARLVQIGSSAASEVALDPAVLRFPLVSILGFSNRSVPRDARADAYARLAGHVAAGELNVDVEAVPLAAVEAAWERQRAGPHRKLVIVP